MLNRRVVMLSQFSGLVRYVTPCQASDQRSIATHTGLHWHRELPSGRHFLNCGATGRPANDGRACVWYAAVAFTGGRLSVEFIPLEYDHLRFATEMLGEELPQEFITTIETGWWTTCLEVLPAKERARGIH